jgi:hypothetical protein
MVKLEKYNFSFTASSLRLKEMVIVAENMINNSQLDLIKELGGGKNSTGKRMLIEYEKRLSKLTKNEIQLLVNGDYPTKKQMAFLSVCKSQRFIRDFVLEVLREKLLVFDYQITEGDYISFYRRKSELYPDMEKLSEVTVNKIKQVTFKILEQAGIIDNIKSKIIQPQLLDAIVINTIASDNKQWLKVFFMSDMDIENIN